MTNIRTKLVTPIVAGLLCFGALAAYQLIESPALPGTETAQASVLNSAERAGAPAADFALKDVQGRTVHLSDFKGKVVLLNFWATWCQPCVKEIPELNAIQKQYAAQGLQCLGIALDEEGLARVKPFLVTNEVDYPVLISQKTPEGYGELTSIPQSFIIDRQGNIQQHFTGARQPSVLEGMLKPLLAK